MIRFEKRMDSLGALVLSSAISNTANTVISAQTKTADLLLDDFQCFVAGFPRRVHYIAHVTIANERGNQN